MKLACFACLVAIGASGCGGPEPQLPGHAYLWAGTGLGGLNYDDDLQWPAKATAHRLDALLYFPEDVTFGPDGRGYIVDWNNHVIRRVEADDSLVVVVGTDYEGDGPPEMEDRLPVGNPAGAPGTTVAMNHTTDVEIGPDGKLYIAAWHNNKIRVFEPDTGRTTVLAGVGYGFAGDDGPCYLALFDQPKAVAVDADGTVYTIDQRNVRIRRITPDRIITTIAGDGTAANTGDGGPAAQATWGFDDDPTPRPSGALALVGRTLYVADSENHRIRKIDLDTGVVDHVAGDPAGAPGFVDGAATDARFDYPIDLELGPEGRLYVADRYNNAIRTIELATGLVERVVGTGLPCPPDLDCATAEGAPALETQLDQPYGIGFDAAGNLYVADTHHHRILKVIR